MKTSVRSHSSPRADPSREALGFIGVTLVVGVAVATVFTAFTPTGQLPVSASQPISAGAATRVSGQNATAGPTLPATAPPDLPLVGVVSGHKGNDSGAVCADGLTEAEVNDDIATRVKVGLEASGFAVDLLSEFDRRLYHYSAHALVSIHADSCAYINELATGFKVAAAKNSRVPDSSERLAACLTDRYGRMTGLSYHAGSITPDMTFYHGFDELAEGTPAAIIETGFLNLDRDFLTRRPEVAAQGIIDGIICYLRSQPVPLDEP